jgi:hypothetical protein
MNLSKGAALVVDGVDQVKIGFAIGTIQAEDQVERRGRRHVLRVLMVNRLRGLCSPAKLDPASAVDGGIPRQTNSERLCPAPTDMRR